MIYEKLDRTIAHSLFIGDFPNTNISYENFTVSDHTTSLSLHQRPKS